MLTSKALAAQFSSATDLWETPQWLFDELDREFGFSLDVCAIPENAKCQQFFTADEDEFCAKAVEYGYPGC